VQGCFKNKRMGFKDLRNKRVEEKIYIAVAED
jgi:hypothetical protein